MNLERFTTEREPLWRELDGLVTASRGNAQRLGPDRLLRLGQLYRAAAADLAFARRRWPSDPVVPKLDRLVNRARVIVYGAPAKRGSVRSFFARDYWVRLMERPVMLVVAAALLFGPMVLTAVWASSDPAAASNLVPSGFEEVTEPKPEGQDLGFSPGEEAAFSSKIFTNNIQVTFLAFAGGALAGLGTAWILGFNGVFIGALSGLAFQAGNGVPFTELVIAHGVLELSCIVVCGAAGLRFGWAMVAPGHRPRIEATMDEARRGVEIVLGTMPWLVVAGLVEGFVTPAGLGLAINAIVGIALGILFWGLAFRLGRVENERSTEDLAPAQSRALAFARK